MECFRSGEENGRPVITVQEQLLRVIKQKVYPSIDLSNYRIDKSFFETVLTGLSDAINECQLSEDHWWIMTQILVLYATDFPHYIAKTLSPKNPGIACVLYAKPEIKKSLGARDNDSALVVAAREQDSFALYHMLRNGGEQVRVLNTVTDGHPPVLFVAVLCADLTKDKDDYSRSTKVLVDNGANLNLSFEGKTVVELAIHKNSLALVEFMVRHSSFNWAQHVNIMKVALVNYQSPRNTDRDAAKRIFEFLLGQLSEKAVEIVHPLIDGHTFLTYTIVHAPAVAKRLIDGDLSSQQQWSSQIFETDSKGQSALYWARHQKNAALVDDISAQYQAKIGLIVDMLLRSDRLICKPSSGQSSTVLVANPVNDWLDLKQKMFEMLSARVEDENTSCEALRKMLIEIQNPNSTIRQFFDHGKKGFFDSQSPWAKQFNALSDKIMGVLDWANRVNNSSSESDTEIDFFNVDPDESFSGGLDSP